MLQNFLNFVKETNGEASKIGDGPVVLLQRSIIWCQFRPMIALAVIVLGLAAFGLLISMRKPKSAPSAKKIISDYCAFVERHGPSPFRIEDVAVLPHSKDVNTLRVAKRRRPRGR
jgi:hypothetical protein